MDDASKGLDDGVDEATDDMRADVPPDRYHGFCFFHSQDMDRALNGEGLLLAFGPIDSDEAQDTVRIGRLVCEALRQHGLQTRWNGSADQRIDLPTLRWQRRTPD